MSGRNGQGGAVGYNCPGEIEYGMRMTTLRPGVGGMPRFVRVDGVEGGWVGG